MSNIEQKIVLKTKKIAIVVSTFNQDITEALLQGAIGFLKNKINKEDVMVVHVPGAIEIPLALQQLARMKKFDALVALGAVIYGETDHYHYVCDHVNAGVGRVMLDESIPIGFGVLTVRDRAQAVERSGGAKGNAGAEAAEAAFSMLSVLEQCHSIVV